MDAPDDAYKSIYSITKIKDPITNEILYIVIKRKRHIEFLGSDSDYFQNVSFPFFSLHD